MYSITTLMDIVEKKNQYIKNVLLAQTKYQLQLDDNIKETKHEIQRSFERLLSDVQCRKQQINDGADAIYKLKKTASLNRIDTLQSISSALDECLDMYCNGSNENETMQHDVIKNILNKIDSQNMEFADDALLTWSCNEYQLKEMIKQYGVIDVKNQIEEYESENDFELVPQHQTFQVEVDYANVSSKEDVKDKIEKSDIDQVRHEMESCSINDEKRSEESGIYIERSSQIDQVLKVEDDFQISDLSSWLHSVNQKPQIETVEEIKTATKVESWLKGCSDLSDCQWLAPSKKSNQNDKHKSRIPFDQFDIPLTNWLRESSTKYEECRVPLLCKEDIKIDYYASSESQADEYDTDNEWLAPFKRNISQSPTTTSESWLASPSSSSSVISKSIKSKHIVSNHFQNIADQSLDAFLHAPTQSNLDDKKAENKRSKFIKKSLAHMNKISEQSSNDFLVKPKKLKIQKDESYCDWLAGKSNNKCNDCSDECAFENKNIDWIKTATDW